MMPVKKSYIERLKCSISWRAAVYAAARFCACVFSIHLLSFFICNFASFMEDVMQWLEKCFCLSCCIWNNIFYLQKACETVMEIIDNMSTLTLPMLGEEPMEETQQMQANSRVLLMLQCNDIEVLPQCLQLLITGLKVFILYQSSNSIDYHLI